MRKIQMMGIDHSRATVAERELFSLTKAKQKELMEAVIRQQGVGGCVLLSTCNRTELYVSLQKEEDIDLYRIFCHIREIPQTAQDEPVSYTHLDVYKRQDQIIVCNELGCGVVPMDAFERAWRERTGRLGCELAKQAEAVYRVTCGIGTRIK